MTTLTILIVIALMGILYFLKASSDKRKLLEKKMTEKFPESWRTTLENRVLFYVQLNKPEKELFERRVQYFLASKNIEGVDVEVDDTIRLLVASSAIIPTFAFSEYNYPNVHTILIYPNSFDEKFRTDRFQDHREFITGMADGRSQNNTVILSKPDLIMGFDGLPHKKNVGIHEFIHMLDKEDGDIDGVPEILITNGFVGPWLHEIKKEMKRIEKGKSDIRRYALENNAEFLAVVSEYFFENPARFQKKHPELQQFLSQIFNRDKHLPSHKIVS